MSVPPPGWSAPAGSSLAESSVASYGTAAPVWAAGGTALGEPPLDQRSTIWARIGAYYVDSVIACLGAAGLLKLTGEPLNSGGFSWGFAAYFMIFWVAVRVLSPRLTGESPGKRIAAIRTVDGNGSDAGAGTRLVREGVLGLAYIVPLLVLIDALIADRRERRSTRDRICGTYVVRVKGAKPRYGQIALIVVCGVIGTLIVLASAVGPQMQAEELHRNTVAECSSRGTPVATCECVYEQLRSRVGDERLLRLARDEQRGIPDPPEVVAEVHSATLACEGRSRRV